MQETLILKNISKHISPSKEAVDFLLSVLEESTLPKKSLLLREAQLCRYIYFVNSGILRAFYLDKTGRESTIMFAMEDWWITDMYCFVNRLPAMLSIETIENSSILQLSKDNFELLCSSHPEFEKFFRILLQNAYIREQLRIIQNLSMTAEERYHQFMEKYPKVAVKVSQKQIASYLGVTPEFLSSIRSSKSKPGRS